MHTGVSTAIAGAGAQPGLVLQEDGRPSSVVPAVNTLDGGHIVSDQSQQEGMGSLDDDMRMGE